MPAGDHGAETAGLRLPLPSPLGQGSAAHPPAGATEKEPNIQPLYHQNRPGASILEPATLGPLGGTTQRPASVRLGTSFPGHYRDACRLGVGPGQSPGKGPERCPYQWVCHPLGASVPTQQCVTFCVAAPRQALETRQWRKPGTAPAPSLGEGADRGAAWLDKATQGGGLQSGKAAWRKLWNA